MKLLRKGSLALFIFTISFCDIYSQTVGGYGNAASIQDVIDPSYQNTNAFYTKTYNDIEGTAFLFDEWSFGKVLTRGQQLINDVKLKYNVFADVLIYREDDKAREIPNKVIQGFTIILPEKEYEFFFYPKVKYVQKIIDGDNFQLYKKYKKSIQKGQAATGYNSGNTSDKFVDDILYYYSLNNSELSLFPKRNKERYSIFDEMIPQGSKKWFKSQKLKIGKEEDIRKAVNLLNL
ncbi:MULTISPECIES: hypothetical protein [unclassified Ekhidna]|jgi:hypothetical protein|uniref:hypothetical protein n=1 Tax=unclassified Ekhidna TaxID=2632188 RepID=UPI0032DF690F